MFCAAKLNHFGLHGTTTTLAFINVIRGRMNKALSKPVLQSTLTPVTVKGIDHAAQ